jgi:hypothetical protein
MKLTLISTLTAVAALAAGATALAQDMPPSPGAPGNPVVSSPDYPHTGGGSPGVPGPEAVNPAPGATGPYVGAGRHGFYDVDQRIADVSNRIASLSPGQRQRAMIAMRGIKSEEATQRARHGGDLRDWDRENLNHKLDMLVQQYPGLGA